MKNLLKQNVGPLDRVLRVLVGVALAILAADGNIRVILMIFGIPLLFSGITGICPTYTLLGISTAYPKNQMTSKMLQACCFASEKFHSCHSIMEDAMERMDNRSRETPKNTNIEQEGRER